MSAAERGEPDVRLEAWGPGDLPLLKRILGDPVMTEHIGGPESDEKLADRQEKYERIVQDGAGQMFKIIDGQTGKPAGSVGYWTKEWRDDTVFEAGWFVLPEFQGRGIAQRATELMIGEAHRDGRHRYLHAFPSVENPPSNGIPRRLGFTLLGEMDFEYPPGHMMRCNDWRLDLAEQSTE